MMKSFITIVLVLCFVGQGNGQKKIVPGSARIAVSFKSLKDSGTLRMSVHRNYISTYDREEDIYPVKLGDTLVFSISEINQPLYICLWKANPEVNRKWLAITDIYLVEAGDNVSVILENVGDKNLYQQPIDRYVMEWKGKGVAKYTCTDEVRAKIFRRGDMHILDSNYQFLENTWKDSSWLDAKKILSKHRKHMSTDAFSILSLDFYAEQEIYRLENLESFKIFKEDEKIVYDVKKRYEAFSKRNAPIAADLHKIVSAKYAHYMTSVSKIGICTTGGNLLPNKKEEYFAKLSTAYKGELRDKLLTMFCLEHLRLRQWQQYVEKALTVMTTPYYVNKLNSIIENNAVGKPAYKFSLPDTSGRVVSLEEFKGRVVFIDFWFTGCGGCAQYYNRVVKDVKTHFKTNPDVSFVTISIDATRDRWMNAIYSNEYTSPDAINLYTGGEGSGHPIIKHYNVNSYPRPLLIDKKGNIFSYGNEELRLKGVEGLVDIINKALKG